MLAPKISPTPAQNLIPEIPDDFPGFLSPPEIREIAANLAPREQIKFLTNFRFAMRRSPGDFRVEESDGEFLMKNFAALDQIPRAGWLARGISNEMAETVFEHTRGGWALVALAGGGDADQLWLKIHDIPEKQAGDHQPTQYGGIDRAEKKRLEDLAAREIFDEKPELYRLFHEENPIRAFCDQCDAQIQAAAYILAGYPADRLRDFLEYGEKTLPPLFAEIPGISQDNLGGIYREAMAILAQNCRPENPIPRV